MHKQVAILTGAAVLSLLYAGCSSLNTAGGPARFIPPDNVIANATGMDLNQVRADRELYEIKCAKCHEFYNPGDYSVADWNRWMKKMARKAKLSLAEETALTRYTGALRN